MHLEVGEAQKKEEARWFSYSTFYTTEESNRFYCMPKAGGQARFYFSGSDEDDAIVISTVRKDG